MREEHAILDGITLPFDDKFWDEFFPPNGWNCRCEAIQVSKKRYEPSNPSEALARGRAATYKPNADGVNKAAIFRFNPGKEQRIFPKRHPYIPKSCSNCGLNQYAIGGNNNNQCPTLCKITNIFLKKAQKKLKIDLKGVVIKNPIIKTNNTFVFTSDARKNIAGHCENIEEIAAVRHLVSNPNDLMISSRASKPIDTTNHKPKNVAKKSSRKVVCYNYYEIEHNGKRFQFSCENIDNKYEQLYGIKTL